MQETADRLWASGAVILPACAPLRAGCGAVSADVRAVSARVLDHPPVQLELAVSLRLRSVIGASLAFVSRSIPEAIFPLALRGFQGVLLMWAESVRLRAAAVDDPELQRAKAGGKHKAEHDKHRIVVEAK